MKGAHLSAKTDWPLTLSFDVSQSLTLSASYGFCESTALKWKGLTNTCSASLESRLQCCAYVDPDCS